MDTDKDDGICAKQSSNSGTIPGLDFTVSENVC